MKRVVEQYECDRCDLPFEKRRMGCVTVTMEIGWFRFVNGSGSKATSKGRSWENLDYDLCNSCTESFDRWWKSGKT